MNMAEKKLTIAQIQEQLRIINDWELANNHLQKIFTFKDFSEALAFTNKVGEIAEKQNHHPDIHLAWGKVVVETWTHSADGITEKDFMLASAIDTIKR